MEGVLGPTQRAQLQTWMKENTTGNTQIRAGVPMGWIIGDKTGSGDYGTTNDIGVIWPPNQKPIIVVVYLTQSKKTATDGHEVIAEATRLILNQLSPMPTSSNS